MPVIPASAFAMVLGTAGLADSWQAASVYWVLPATAAAAIPWLAIAIWFVLTILYAAKWIFFRKDALEGLRHPVQGCFIGLAGVAAMLAAGAMQGPVVSFARSAKQALAHVSF